MGRVIKTFLIIVVCLVLAAAGTLAAFALWYHIDIKEMFSDKFETNTVSVKEDFSSVMIDTDTEDIDFSYDENGGCRVVFYERALEPHRAYVSGGTLFIEPAEKKIPFNFFSSGTPRVTVYLPRHTYDTLTINESTGDVEIPDGFSFGNIDIGVSTGDVNCGACAEGKLKISTSTGSVITENLSTGSLDLTVTTGSVDVRSVTCAGDINLTVSTGRALLSDVTCKNFTTGGSTGRIIMERLFASGLISVTRSTGDVTFELSDAEEISVITDTGDVTGTLLSDKIFIVRSDTGRIDVPESVTGGKCKVTTDTGDILLKTGHSTGPEDG